MPNNNKLYQEWVNYVIEKIVNINLEAIQDMLFEDVPGFFDAWVYPVTAGDLSGYYPYITNYIDDAINVSGHGDGYLLPEYLIQYGAADDQKFATLEVQSQRPASEILGSDNLRDLYLKASQTYFDLVEQELSEAYAFILKLAAEKGISTLDYPALQAAIKATPYLTQYERKCYSDLASKKYAEAALEHILS